MRASASKKRLEGYRLDVARSEYEPMLPDDQGRYRSQVLGLWLGIERGVYHKRDEPWLRWIDDSGHVLPCGTDLAESAQAEAQQAQAEAQLAHNRLVLAGRALVLAGKDPAEVASMLGVAIEELS